MSRLSAYWLFRGAYPLAVQKNSGLGKFLAEKASATNGEETVMVTLKGPITTP